MERWLENFLGDGKEDVDDFLEKFQMLADVNGWVNNVICVQLASCLGGCAKSWYNTLSPKVKMDAGKLIQHLREAFKMDGISFLSSIIGKKTERRRIC